MTTPDKIQPDKIIELIEAFRRSKTMFAAVQLGIFDGARPSDCKELPRLLDACVALGLLEKRDGIYVNTPEADKYLRSGSPDSLTGPRPTSTASAAFCTIGPTKKFTGC